MTRLNRRSPSLADVSDFVFGGRGREEASEGEGRAQKPGKWHPPKIYLHECPELPRISLDVYYNYVGILEFDLNFLIVPVPFGSPFVSSKRHGGGGGLHRKYGGGRFPKGGGHP